LLPNLPLILLGLQSQPHCCGMSTDPPTQRLLTLTLDSPRFEKQDIGALGVAAAMHQPEGFTCISPLTKNRLDVIPLGNRRRLCQLTLLLVPHGFLLLEAKEPFNKVSDETFLGLL
jgi:hypothetical protein